MCVRGGRAAVRDTSGSGSGSGASDRSIHRSIKREREKSVRFSRVLVHEVLPCVLVRQVPGRFFGFGVDIVISPVLLAPVSPFGVVPHRLPANLCLIICDDGRCLDVVSGQRRGACGTSRRGLPYRCARSTPPPPETPPRKGRGKRLSL